MIYMNQHQHKTCPWSHADEQRRDWIFEKSEGGDKSKLGRLFTWSGVPGSSYIAEGVSPVAGRVDVARGGWAVAVGSRGVGDDGGLAGVTGADPQSSCGDRRRAGEWTKEDLWRIFACCCVGLYLACQRGVNGTGSVDSVWLPQWGEGLLASPTPDCRSPPALMASPPSDALARLYWEWPETALPEVQKQHQLWSL